MSWTDFPPPATAFGMTKYDWVNQPWQGVQERVWAAGNWVFPKSNWSWANGFVTGLTNNGDGTWTVTDSAASYAVNRYYGFSDPSNPWIPEFYDLIFDDPLDEKQCLHVQILGNTATTFKITGQQIQDALTSGWIGSTSVLVGLRYWVIKRGGEWWSERWLVWPNDSEQWVGMALQAGAVVPVKLTAKGTTVTATAKNHGFLNGDSVTISGAVSTNNRYNGTFAISGATTNTFQYTISTGDSSPATGSPTATCPYNGAYDPVARYPINKFQSGYELMVKGSTGSLERITITGNDAQNLFFARQTFTVAGQYAIVKAGAKWRFYNSSISQAASTDGNPYAGPPFRWYHSYWDHYVTHLPDDSIGTTTVPASVIQLQAPDGTGGCTATEDVCAFDQDVWTALDDLCNTPDWNLTPDFFRTLHALQVAIENVCYSYVKVQSYEGAAAIPTLVPATLFLLAGINAFTTTTTTVGTDGHGNSGINIASITLPAAAQNKLNLTGAIGVYYAVLDSNGVCQNSGIGNLTSNTFLTPTAPCGGAAGTFSACSGSSSSSNPGTGIGCNPIPAWCDENRTIVISLGWTRQFASEFLYMYQASGFIPSVNPDTSTFVDPPTSEYPGVWATRAASTKYKEHDGVGMVRDSNGYYTFQTGDYVRYSGDNSNDPTIHEGISGTTITNNDEDKTTTAPIPDPAPYFDAFFEGQLSTANQEILDASRTGVATGGSAFSLQDTTKNWWPKGVMRTETGTASSGGTTSLTDSSKAGNGLWDASTGRWVGFILEMLINGTWYRRPITGMSGTTLSWTEPLPVSCSGCTYQIREPRYNRNRWLGRSLMVTLDNGETHTIPILYNDDQNIYFAQQSFSITKETHYQIIEYYRGGVWKYGTTINPNNNTYWQVPTGNDTRSGSGVPWLNNQAADEPTHRTDYGHVNKGDYAPQILTELYNALNVLLWVKWPLVWTGSASGSCERNQNEAPSSGAGIGDILDQSDGAHACLHGWDSHIGAASLWTTDNCTASGCGRGVDGDCSTADGIADYLQEVDAAPLAWCFADNGAACCFSCGYERRYAYGTVTGIIPYQQCAVDWYVYASVSGDCEVNMCDCAYSGESGFGHNYTFNAEGDGLLFQQWHKYDSSAPSNAESRMSAKLGSLTIPTDATVANNGGNPCAPCNYGCPGDDRTGCTDAGYGAPLGPYCSHWDGYIVTDQCAILTWNNPNGFRKYV